MIFHQYNWQNKTLTALASRTGRESQSHSLQDIIHASAYSFLTLTPEFFLKYIDEIEYKDIISKLCEQTTNICAVNMLRVNDAHLWNETLITANGRVQIKYVKKVDGGERRFAKNRNLRAIYGNESDSNFFQINETSFRIDTCNDVFLNSRTRLVDVHLQPCCGMPTKNGMHLKEGGLLIVADGSRSQTQTYVKNKKDMRRLNPTIYSN